MNWCMYKMITTGRNLQGIFTIPADFVQELQIGNILRYTAEALLKKF
jgi:hypothetical protein